MIIKDLITQVREDYLDDTLGVDTNDSLVSEKALVRFFAEAEKESCRRMDMLYDETTLSVCSITIVAGTQSYALSEYITKLERVTWNGKDLPKKVESMYEGESWRSDTGDPTSYYVRQRRIYLHPTPDADAVTTDSTLSLGVYRLPVTAIYTDQQSFEIPLEFQADLMYWVLYRVYNLRDEDLFNPQDAQLYLSLFTERFGDVVPADVRLHQFESPKILGHVPKDEYRMTGTTSLGDDDFDSTGWS